MKPQHPITGHATRYAYGRQLDRPFAQALEHTRTALQNEGFGVVFEIDLKLLLLEKLGVDFRNYVILGACSPQVAHHALLEELDLGLLLPHTVVVFEAADGRTAVKAIDIAQLLAVTGNPKLESTATEVDERLHKVIDGL